MLICTHGTKGPMHHCAMPGYLWLTCLMSLSLFHRRCWPSKCLQAPVLLVTRGGLF